MTGDWYAIRFQLAPGFDHEDALEVLAAIEHHPAVGPWTFGDADAPTKDAQGRPAFDEDRPAETTRDLRTPVGGGLYVKPLGHTPPDDKPALDEDYVPPPTKDEDRSVGEYIADVERERAPDEERP